MSIVKLLVVCFGGSRLGVSSDGLPYLSNFYCLPGKAGGSPADARCSMLETVEMSDKLKVTRERNYSAHHKLIGAARIAVESAIKREPGWSYAVIVGISLCGLAVEAICNAIGDRVVPEPPVPI